MNSEAYYTQVVAAMRERSGDRHRELCSLHDRVLEEYIDALLGIDAVRAAETGEDGRTVLQVVGHILEWDRWMVQSLGEIISGVRSPRMLRLQGFLENDGTEKQFTSVDEFNAYQAERYRDVAWEPVQQAAIAQAIALHRLFTTPGLADAVALERTAPETWETPAGEKLNITSGWNFWQITLEHQVVSHAADLGLLE